MIVTKLEITRKDVTIVAETVRLLKKQEYNFSKSLIVPLSVSWWLADNGKTKASASIVKPDGTIECATVNDPNIYVRPAIILDHRNSCLNGGDKFEFAGYTWTMLKSRYIVLCDTFVWQMPFKNDWRLFDSNYYPKSDVSRWVINWAVDNGILDKEGKADDRR